MYLCLRTWCEASPPSLSQSRSSFGSGTKLTIVAAAGCWCRVGVHYFGRGGCFCKMKANFSMFMCELRVANSMVGSRKEDRNWLEARGARTVLVDRVEVNRKRYQLSCLVVVGSGGKLSQRALGEVDVRRKFLFICGRAKRVRRVEATQRPKRPGSGGQKPFF